MSGDRLDVVLAPEARALWTKSLQPVARSLGFRPGKLDLRWRRGWIREASEVRQSFWFQIDQKFGFDRRMGGRFVVEFIMNNSYRRTAVRDRMWWLLDGLSRSEVIRINNAVIASLPGPSPEIMDAIHANLRPYYAVNFETVEAIPAPDADVWFRYATRVDAAKWGDFIASRLPSVVTECERRLANLQPGTSSMGGAVIKAQHQD